MDSLQRTMEAMAGDFARHPDWFPLGWEELCADVAPNYVGLSRLAQLAEQLVVSEMVRGSSPRLGASSEGREMGSTRPETLCV